MLTGRSEGKRHCRRLGWVTIRDGDAYGCFGVALVVYNVTTGNVAFSSLSLAVFPFDRAVHLTSSRYEAYFTNYDAT